MLKASLARSLSRLLLGASVTALALSQSVRAEDGRDRDDAKNPIEQIKTVSPIKHVIVIIGENHTFELANGRITSKAGLVKKKLGNLNYASVRVVATITKFWEMKRFPLDIVKVDRSFVHGLGRDDGDSAIVGAVLGMAQALGLEVVAEGVENAEQLACLHDLGAEYAQGFYFARPLPKEELAEVLSGRRVET